MSNTTKYRTFLEIKAQYLRGEISFEVAIKEFFNYASHPDARELNIKSLRLWHELKTGVIPSKEYIENILNETR